MDLLALAIAQEFSVVDVERAVATLDALGAELTQRTAQAGPAGEEAARACSQLLVGCHGFRGGIPIGGVGLPGHFVVAHFGEDPPLLLDPFDEVGSSAQPSGMRSCSLGELTRSRCGC